MSSALVSLLGPTLTTTGVDSVPTSAALAGVDNVLLYFSAHWCPPCKAFTPALASFFSAHGAARRFTVVFVSSDKSDGEFQGYLSSMPWSLALPRSAERERSELGRRFRVAGIPHLVVLDAANGTLITDAARERVMADPAAAAFPWRPRSAWEILAEGAITDAAGGAFALADLRARRATALYFSAHWCPPCRGFTPELAAWYRAQGAAADVEIVFISSDHDAAAFREYLGEMPWKALAYEARAAKEELSQLFGVEGIPTLVFIDGAGAVITKEGRACVGSEPDGFPWPAKPRDDLSTALRGYLNDEPTLVLFTDTVTDGDAEKEAVAALDAAAAAAWAAAGGKPGAVRFALATANDDATDRVRGFVGGAHTRDREGPRNARVTLIDVPSRKKTLFKGGALGVPTAEELTAFLRGCADGSIAPEPIKG